MKPFQLKEQENELVSNKSDIGRQDIYSCFYGVFHSSHYWHTYADSANTT